MHGIVHFEFSKFVKDRFGKETWEAINRGVGHELYLTTKAYPDTDLVILLEQLSDHLQKPIPDLLYTFGQYLTQPLLEVYGVLIDPSWSFIDFLSQIETTIHKVVRMKNPHADPPKIDHKRIDEKTIEIYYKSHRKLCPLARGLIDGMAKHYKAKYSLKESTCMHRGDSLCTFHIAVD